MVTCKGAEDLEDDPESLKRELREEELYKNKPNQVVARLDRLSNEIDDIRDDFAEVVSLPEREEDLSKHGRRMASIRDRLTNLSEEAVRIHEIVKEELRGETVIIAGGLREQEFKAFEQAIKEWQRTSREAFRQRDMLIQLHSENHPDCEKCSIHVVRDKLYSEKE